MSKIIIPNGPLDVKTSVAEREYGQGRQQAGRVRRLFKDGAHPIAKSAQFVMDYIALPETEALVIAAWVMGAWLSEVWDSFPHLVITSPEKRCGKTTLLNILEVIVPKPQSTSNISPAALYRVIALNCPTVLFDEAQSLSRRGSESSEVTREIFNAGIARNSKAIRCGGKAMDKIKVFPIYSPKVVALIGDLDGVLADRCLPIVMRRKTDADVVERYRSRTVAARGAELKQQLEEWAREYYGIACDYYSGDFLEPFDIANDRMADLLLPLQCVLTISDIGGLDILEKYAISLDERDKEQETQSPGVRMLAACRELFNGTPFISTKDLIGDLVERTEEPWNRWSRGEGINPEALARLLRPYGIRPQHDKRREQRGYFASEFTEAWDRYLAPL